MNEWMIKKKEKALDFPLRNQIIPASLNFRFAQNYYSWRILDFKSLKSANYSKTPILIFGAKIQILILLAKWQNERRLLKITTTVVTF